MLYPYYTFIISILGLTSMVYVVGLVVAKAITTDTSKVTYRDG